MQRKILGLGKKVLIMLIVFILTMGDVVVIGENTFTTSIPNVENEEELLEISQELITSKQYQIGEEIKNVLQIAIKLNAEKLEESALQQTKITQTTPILEVEPEEIYITEQNKANYVEATWEYENNQITINLQNDELERIKQDKTDELIITYIYSQDIDTSKIETTAKAEGKLYNGNTVTSKDNIYEYENTEVFGEIIKISSKVEDIYKTELQKENQIFTEQTNINLSYKNTEIVNKIILKNSKQEIYNGETKLENNAVYKTSTINKQELLEAIGEDGTLTVRTEEKEIIKIDKNTEADEFGNIIISYEEEIQKLILEIEIGGYTKAEGKIEKGIFNIKHEREILQNDKKEESKQIKTIEVSLIKDERISNFKVVAVGEIKNKTTKSELGLNTQELSNAKENEITATITMHTEDKKYDLNKNPEFKIVIPKEIEKVEIGKVTLLNNKNFTIENTEIQENGSGQKEIVITLSGEQTEYVETAGNVQIIVPLKLTTKKLIPTTSTNIELYYTNEKAESYENEETEGRETAEIQIISEEDIIVATEAKIGEKQAISYRNNIETLEIQKTEEEQKINIKGTIINNTDEVKEGIIIIGKNELLSEVETSKGTVKYSKAIDGDWQESYTAGDTYYKIEIEKMEARETLEFTYNMQILEEMEETTKYEVLYEVYEQENLIKESKVEVNVEVKQKEAQGNKEENKEENDLEIRYRNEIHSQSGLLIENLELRSRMINEVYILNNSNEAKKATIEIELDECFVLKEGYVCLYRFEGDYATTQEGEVGDKQYKKYENKKHEVIGENTIRIEIDIPAKADIVMTIEPIVYQYLNREVNTKIKFVSDKLTKEFEDTKIAIKPIDMAINMRAFKDNMELKNKDQLKLKKGDQLTFTMNLKNTGGENNLYVGSNIPKNFELKSLKIYKENILIEELKEKNLEKYITNEIDLEHIYIESKVRKTIEIGENEELDIELILELKNEIQENTTINKTFSVSEGNKVIDANEIELTLLPLTESVTPDDPIEPDEPNMPDIPGEPTVPEVPQEKKYNISGIAWLDKNRNGQQDKNEDYLKGIEVSLLNAETNEKVATEVTDINGKYQFKNLNKGKYVVIFAYNKTTYKLTTYKQQGVEESKNSDGIVTTLNGENVAKTEVIELYNNDISNIDIGFILNEKFDLEITKQIKKVTVKNNAGQTVYEYKNTNFAKIEIPSKYLKGTNLVIEYEVAIVNKGDISGYAKTLTDNKPEGLKFASELNTSWYEGINGKLHCVELSQDEIKAGEARTINLVLTKEIEDTKVQYITNEVELEETFNEYLQEENDLTNNKAEATLIVAIKTGAVKTYWSLWLACAVIIGVGIRFIKKYTIG